MQPTLTVCAAWCGSTSLALLARAGIFRLVLYLLLPMTALFAGPVEFGLAEFQSALAARGMRPGQIRLAYEIGGNLEAGGWRIEGTRVTGGDLAGLMYGLLEAADQVRSRGWLAQAQGSAALAIRGVRLSFDEEVRHATDEDWRGFVRLLAQSRINRLQLVVGEPESHIEQLASLSRLCADHAVDFVVGLPRARAEGLTLYTRLKSVFAACPLVRSIHVRLAGNPTPAFYRDWLVRAVGEAGRLVSLELDGVPEHWPIHPVRQARPFVDEPWKIGSAPAETYFEVPSPLNLGAPVWADPTWTRYVAGVIERSRALGLEVEAPWPWRRHALFYEVWGRMAYSPRTSEKALASDFARHLPKAAAADLFTAWTSASRAFTFAALLQPGRWLATAEEAARLKREGIGSAKLTPGDMAAAIHEAAGEARQALTHAEAAGGELEDGANLLLLIETARQRAQPAAAGAVKPVARPAFLHFPPRVAPANIKFLLGLNIKPLTNVRRVRLHYRTSTDDGDFRTMEASPARAWFPMTVSSDLVYYFEVISTDNKGWFYPDPLAGTPYLFLPVRARR